MPSFFRTNDAGGGNRYFRTNAVPATALLSISSDNVVVGVESNAPYTSLNAAGADGIVVSSSNTASTQSWSLTGVSATAGTIVSTTRGNLPYTDANHALLASLYADVNLIGTLGFTHNPPSGYIALPVLEAEIDRTQNQSIFYGMATAPAYSQVKVPTSIGGFAITWELSTAGNATGRFSVDGILAGSTSMLGVEFRDGSTGAWSTIAVTVTPIGISTFLYVVPSVAAALSTSIRLAAAAVGVSSVVDANLTTGSVVGRSIQLQLLTSPQNPQPVAMKQLRIWTRIAEGYAPVDGGVNGTQITTNENGGVFITGLNIPAGPGVLTVMDPLDVHKSRNLHVVFQ